MHPSVGSSSARPFCHASFSQSVMRGYPYESDFVNGTIHAGAAGTQGGMVGSSRKPSSHAPFVAVSHDA